MLIDWFTTAAQILNFVVLIWLLKRVLYKPIMAAINAREALVAKELADAAATMLAANQAAEQFRLKNESLERDRALLLKQASEDARAQGARLVEQARSGADALSLQQRDGMAGELQNFREGLARRAQQGFFELARRAFADLADSSLEAQMTALFCRRLRAIKPEDKTALASAMRGSPGTAVVRSACELPDALRQALKTVISQSFESDIPLRYEVAPDLVSGIELCAGGLRVSWSIAGYLTALERGLQVAIPGAAPEAVPGPPAVKATAVPALMAVT